MTIESNTSTLSPIEEPSRANALLDSLAMRQDLEDRVEELRLGRSASRSHPDSKRYRIERALLIVFGFGQVVAATLFVVWMVRSGKPEDWKVVLAVAFGFLGYTQALLMMIRGSAERNELRILEALLDTRWRGHGPPASKNAE